MSQAEPKITPLSEGTEDEGGEGECFVVCCMLKYQRISYCVLVRLSRLLFGRKKERAPRAAVSLHFDSSAVSDLH